MFGRESAEKFVLSKLHLKALESIPLSILNQSNIKVDHYIERSIGHAVMNIEATLAGRQDCSYVSKTIRYPKNWIEAIKDRFFPGWLAKLFPVRYTCVDVTHVTKYNVCPHLPTVGAGPHVEFVCTPARTQPLQSA